MSITLKVCGKANGLVQQAKRQVLNQAAASSAMKSARRSAIIDTGLTATNGALTAVNISGGNTGLGIATGLCTALAGLMTGAQLKEFIKASKAKKQAANALTEIMNKPEFKDIIQRFKRIKGANMSTEDFLKAIRDKFNDGVNIVAR